MRDDYELGIKLPQYDPRGIWTGPHPAYEGWAPKEPSTRSSWWLVAAGLALVIIARSLGA